jgi:hypothetical protein
MSLAVVDHTLELENLAFRGTGGEAQKTAAAAFDQHFLTHKRARSICPALPTESWRHAICGMDCLMMSCWHGTSLEE